MNKRFFVVVAFLVFSINLCFSQSDLKEIILNKKNTLPSNWVKSIQDQGTWEFQKAVTVKKRKVKDHYLGINGKVFDFERNRVAVTPFHHKIGSMEYSDLDIVYHDANNTIVMSTDVQNGSRTRNQKTVYQVINLTKEYLILEEIKDMYCFDFSTGKILTKKECKAKEQNEAKKLFGGKEINIGKVVNRRLVFKAKNK